MDDFGMGYALGQDSGSSCRDGGSGMWGGDGSWIFAFLIIALIFGGRGGLFGGGWGGNSGGYGDGINSPAGQGAGTWKAGTGIGLIRRINSSVCAFWLAVIKAFCAL